MRITELIGAILLPADGRLSREGILRNAVIQKIADQIRREMQTGVAGGKRGLPVERAFGMLPGGNRILGQFVLPLVQVVAQECRLTVDVEAERRLKTLLIRNLEFIV